MTRGSSWCAASTAHARARAFTRRVVDAATRDARRNRSRDDGMHSRADWTDGRTDWTDDDRRTIASRSSHSLHVVSR